ncbi:MULTISPECIES: phosphodiester glycosidase family protein [Enterococcus]|uniref:phosphodiester glycosidase family protein n=1 Tax=Enterococcus TaxID=1350 RepID=UPI00064C8FDD|nr:MULTISPECIES: phosphodiester glycosidase family protein [Enterococcus]EME8113984.1 phosphodiester glycosidase family protein [Enterococcus faecium]EMF0630322.1 phosphodiester glycosidase family protein [Enterococcus faecium]MBX9060348.1 phosphodiester glycosidase family protein [Enterococcus faecium]MCA6732274.1 phosphodiester glycosidase family protein [Enterococcus lactis]MDQ8431529.1 phosphodiester glycosidase family protein [Enterococcus faecium]
MKHFLRKKYMWACLSSVFLLGSSSYILLKTFVLPQEIAAVESVSNETSTSTTDTKNTSNSSSFEPLITDNSYQDENINITLSSERVDETTVYVADITVSDSSYLKTALANNTYGRNIKETTSAIAQEQQAILAINGDYYGFRDTGYVLRNGTLYRDTPSIDKNGDFSIIKEAETSAEKLVEEDVQQVLSFGPALVEDGEVTVSEDEEVSQSMQSNPRTVIAQVGTNHYLVVVSEGRTDDSQGLSLSELATVLKNHGAKTAYNLDGGGSTTLYFNGKVINQTVGGSGNSERSVSDIVFIG